MWKNYLKITLRGFAKHKLTFFINLFGLSLGIGVAVLIGLWVKDELNVDRGFSEEERIMRIMEHQTYGAEIFTTTSTPGLLAAALKDEFADVELAACYTWFQKKMLSTGGEGIKFGGLFAENDFVSILDFPLLQGERASMLIEKNSIVITANTANRLFGKTDVLGETIILENESSLKITGVLKDLPENYSEPFDFLIPLDYFRERNTWLDSWSNNGPSTILKLKEGANYQAFSEQIAGFVKTKHEYSNVELFAYPMVDMYLYGQFKEGKQAGGRITYVRLFGLIGVFVLLIACINFMNLATAKSQKRAKEVGVRKVVGADNGNLISQFLTESILLSVFAGLLALVLVALILPAFNQLTDKAIKLPLGDLMFWLQLLIVVLITGLVAGSYPAFYLSATKVVSVFKSVNNPQKGVAWARKGLVLFQFVMASFLIVATIVVYKQIQFVMNQSLGYEKEQVLIFPMEGKLEQQFDVFRNQVLEIPEVKGVSRAGHTLMGRNSNTGSVSWEGKDPDNNVLFEIMRVDYGFIEAMGMQIVSGSSFSPERGADSTLGAIVNQRAYDLIKSDNPENEGFNLWGGERQISGVLANFHFQSFHNEVEPVILLLEPENTYMAFMKIAPENPKATLEAVGKIIKEINPDFPFEYQFMDDRYASMYKQDVKVRDLAKYFSILTILISCLGLFGLSAHVAEQKTKEIGIRKVLGASTLSILHVINKEFILIVLVSILIGTVLSYFVMQDWLSGFAFKISFSWWYLPLAAVVIFSIAYLTVTVQALKASQINPVKTLKSE